MTSNTATTEAAPAPEIHEPKATTKASAGARRAHVAPKKAHSGEKAGPAKKAPKAKKGAKPKESAGPREGSKTAQMLELLKRQGGVTANELMKATGWQPHSVRGFLSGTVGKKMGLDVKHAVLVGSGTVAAVSPNHIWVAEYINQQAADVYDHTEFSPDTAPWLELLTVKNGRAHLYLRYRLRGRA